MFTGIVEELGAVVERDAERLRIGCATVLDDVVLGASIAVNGCCLTVIRWTEGASDGWWEAELTDETWSRTSLGDLRPGDPVNLERPVRPSDRLGGHLVQGHVDGTGTVLSRMPPTGSREWELVRFGMPTRLARYVVEKGSITVDGVSLTVVQVGVDEFSIGLIPTTREVTTLGFRRPGELVNLEVDVVAKYVERLAAPHLGAGTAAARDNAGKEVQ